MPDDQEIKLLEAEVNLLNQQAFSLRVKDSNKTLELSRKALEICNRFHYPKGRADALCMLGFAHIRLSKHKEAIGFLQECLYIFESLNDLIGLSNCNEYFGIIERSFGNYEGSLQYLFRALEYIQQSSYREGESLCNYHLGVTYKYLGNLELALDYFLRSIAIAKEINAWVPESYSLNNIGSIYFELGHLDQALAYYQQSLDIRINSGDQWGEAGCLDNIGYIHFKLGNHALALDYCNKSLQITISIGDKKGQANSQYHLAEIQLAENQMQSSAENARQSLETRRAIGDKRGQAEVMLLLSAITPLTGNQESVVAEALCHLNASLNLARETHAQDILSKIHYGFYLRYREMNRFHEALDHLELFNTIEKEIHSQAINQKTLNLEIEHRIEKSRQEAEIYRLKSVELQTLYEEIKLQKDEIQSQKISLEKTLKELEATQYQLIQKEKMASLGELTSGIAHEIQNPLNFVNNFAELNAELVLEIKESVREKNSAESIALANDIAKNLERIIHHGRRADAIVKGMLQYSGGGAGQIKPTDINSLAEEYLRLGYHAVKTKDNSFNASIKTDLDLNIHEINLIPQDMCRALLNIYNNAFYSVNEKMKKCLPGYEPAVSVTTARISGMVEIRIRDNGIGIPAQSVKKIFQPFYTSKPTGQGTGLGLSLSYEIITKAHLGSISVETCEDEYAEFIIRLPEK